jgi:hypothetical protein
MAAKSASLTVNIIAEAAKAKSGLKEAETAFGRFRGEVGQAQGAMGKFQAISGSAFDYVKKNAMTFAASAGAAIVAFGVKSVNAFQDLALASGKFADATGLSVESASRFIEVAGDIGIEAGAVEKSLGFMNKALGNSPQLFEQLGIEIARTSSGATDVNGTFLNVVERLNEIEDPAARAAAATKILGRGWMELSELIGMGSRDLQASLDAVSEQKVIDPAELQRARDFRAATDNLKDAFEDFSLTIGQSLVPSLTKAFEAASKLADIIDILPGNAKAGAIEQYSKALDDMRDSSESAWYEIGALEAIVSTLWPKVEKNTGVTDELTRSWQGGYRAMIDARNEAANLGSNMRDLQVDTEGATAAWQIFKGQLGIQSESIKIVQNIEDFRAKWAGTTDEAKRKSREYQLELLAIQTQLANSALAIAGLATTAQNTRIRLLIETGQLERALSLIGAIRAGMNQLAGAVTPDRLDRLTGAYVPPVSTPRTTAPAPATKVAPKSAALFGGPKIETKRYAAMATGGTVVGSGMALVGEQGPELVNMPRGASVIPSIPSRQMMGSGQMIVNIQVQAGLVSSPDQVGQQIIDAIRRAERRSGQVFVNA